VYKLSINQFTNPNPVYSHTVNRDGIYWCRWLPS
jgi:hypothetical protein